MHRKTETVSETGTGTGTGTETGRQADRQTMRFLCSSPFLTRPPHLQHRNDGGIQRPGGRYASHTDATSLHEHNR